MLGRGLLRRHAYLSRERFSAELAVAIAHDGARHSALKTQILGGLTIVLGLLFQGLMADAFPADKVKFPDSPATAATSWRPSWKPRSRREHAGRLRRHD